MRRMQNQIRQRRRDDVRQMAGPADEQIMLRRVQPQRPRAERFPKLLQLADGAGIGFFRRGDNANGVGIQIRPRREHAHFFTAGQRMAADKMRAGFFNERFQFAHDIGFHAADVGDNRAAFERGQKLLDERTHLRQRRAKDDEVGVGNGGEQIGRGVIHRAGPFAIFQARRAPDEAGDFAAPASGV